MSAILMADKPYLVVEKEIKESKKKTPYASLLLKSNEGDLQGRIWEQYIHLCDAFNVGDVVMIGGQLQVYNGVRQIIIEAVQRVVDPTPYLDQFEPRAKIDPEVSLVKILTLVDSVTDPQLSQLLNLIYRQDSAFVARLKRGWGGASVHHAWPGGLIDHLAEVGLLVAQAAKQLAGVNYDVAVAGALIHDLSKVDEYAYDRTRGRVDVSERTNLLGHVHLAVTYTEAWLAKVPQLTADMQQHLLHIVASHHESIEWGALVQPLTPEAAVVSAMDRLSAHVYIMNRVRDDIADGGRFSPYESHLGCRVWNPEPRK